MPCHPVKARGYQQGEPSPYLVSRVLLVELDFSWFGNSREIRAGAKHASNVGRTLPVVPDAIPLAGTTGLPDFLPLRTTVDQDPRTSIQIQQRVEYEDYSSIAHT